jgi:molybdopterin molybdotransferase
VSFEMYVRPAILALQGRPDVYRPWFLARSDEPVHRTTGRTEARRCRITHDPAGGVRFTTTGPQGSGILSSMAGAQALFFVPPQYSGGDTGTEMMVMLLAGSGSERPPFPSPPR